MKILDFGSANYDYVYSVDHLAAPGETVSALARNRFFGGKGLNQAVAIARAGQKVFFAGHVGEDGADIEKLCDETGIDRTMLSRAGKDTGHAVIQVSSSGENNIILYPGANAGNTEEYIDSVIGRFEKGDILTLQNEINLLDYVIDRAYERGMRIFLNPSPFNEKITKLHLEKISTFVLNEIEGGMITGEKEEEKILTSLGERFAGASFVLTLGSRGSVYRSRSEEIRCDCVKTEVRDTTAAGDTYTGYLIAGIALGLDMEAAMKRASKAASIAVSRDGAIPSIPLASEVDA